MSAGRWRTPSGPESILLISTLQIVTKHRHNPPADLLHICKYLEETHRECVRVQGVQGGQQETDGRQEDGGVGGQEEDLRQHGQNSASHVLQVSGRDKVRRGLRRISLYQTS